MLFFKSSTCLEFRPVFLSTDSEIDFVLSRMKFSSIFDGVNSNISVLKKQKFHKTISRYLIVNTFTTKDYTKTENIFLFEKVITF